MGWLRTSALFALLLAANNVLGGEFLEDFDEPTLSHDSSARDGWTYMTGDGEATMTFEQGDGVGRVNVDARNDSRNIWWAFIRRSVSDHIDGEVLAKPNRELRVEARVRTDTAPRRVNLHFNHTRTTDYHSHLMEYDIPTTGEWHTISMTTNGFDALPGDDVFVQLALMDWGRAQYELELDYMKVSVVDPAIAGPDLGSPLPYRPAIPPLENYSHSITPVEAGIVHLDHPQTVVTNEGERALLAVGDPLVTLLRWNLGSLEDASPKGWGVLELTTEAVFRAETDTEEFGEMRVVEVLGGDPNWTRETVSLESLLGGAAIDDVLNPQMIVDIPPAHERGEKTRIPISPPALQRLFSGRSLGLAIYGQQEISAVFYAGTLPDTTDGPRLYFNLDESTVKTQEKMR